MLANHLFSTIFESVNKHHFSDLRLQKYAEVAENSLRLIKSVAKTKTWFSKLLQVARLMAYQETSDWNQNFSLTNYSLIGNLSLAKVAYIHDSLTVLFQNTFL